MEPLSYLSNADIDYVEQLYEQYQQQPDSVDPSWQKFFEGFELASSKYAANGHNGNGNGQSAVTAPSAKTSSADAERVRKEHAVNNLIDSYRTRGHLFAKINPVMPRKQFNPPLDYQNFGLTDADLDTVFQAGDELGLGPARLRDILSFLNETYCGTIGVEFRFIRIPKVVNWVRSRVEATKNKPSFTIDEKRHILRMLGKSTIFEGFIHRKFPGQKSFSLEGAESLIPALDSLILDGSEMGVNEFVIGMAHRGRLNVLTNILRKEPDNVFGEFKDKGVSDSIFDGDVKYHMGFSSDAKLPNGKEVHLSLAPNPSHLEAVDPVVEGMARAKMDTLYGGDQNQICPILIHGDASLAGQGVVYEVMQMSRLRGYGVGGTVHFVINNQLGFTTDPGDGRTSTYCTDLAKVTLSPVFHVNGDDPEALVHVAKLAMAFRQEFNRDVFIDVLCYRKYGHNEADEPRFTQPKMYQAIKEHPSPFKIYSNQLLEEGQIEAQMVKDLENELNDYLHDELEQATEFEYSLDTEPKRAWEGIKFYDVSELEADPETGIDEQTIFHIAERITQLPEQFSPHKNLKRVMQQRQKMVNETDRLDWAMGEHLAYGALLMEQHPVRLTGQDSERGTFSHRHAVVIDQETEQKYVPLRHLSDQQAPFYVYNSLLSEYGALGFEVGYSMSSPYALTIWEAQFGDFINGAQIVIDQFLSSAATKWQRLNGAVLYLPHGYEGMGPEHSSARLERFLELCAQNNMYVVNLTTPANLFHALRRQLCLPHRRPLVVFSPKSLLRHPECVSSVKDFQKGTQFQPIIDDPAVKATQVKRIVLCTGKLYYDLKKYREKFEKYDVALVRVEQIYPLAKERLRKIIKQRYKKASSVAWAQEEPANMGAWRYMLDQFYGEIELECVARKSSASPATGSRSQHERQQSYLIKKSLDLSPDVTLD